MMAPGAKRPPPIGSEVTSVGFDGGAECGRGWDEGWRGVGNRAAGRSAARVSRSSAETAVSPSVASGSTDSVGLPQLAQNRAVDETFPPQDVQNMDAGFYHLAEGATNLRGVIRFFLLAPRYRTRALRSLLA